MGNPYISAIVEIQRQILSQTGRRTDVHYKEGYGALFVYEGEELRPENVIFAADEFYLTVKNRWEESGW